MQAIVQGGEGATLLSDIAGAGKKSNGQLKLYRTMYAEEANAIMDWVKIKKSKTEEAVADRIEASKFHNDESLGIIPIRGHLGNREQAETYLNNNKTMEEAETEEKAEEDNRPKNLVEFTLKPGVHKILFTPNYMAVQNTGKLTAVINEVAKARDKDTVGFPAASLNEGGLKGFIGLKSEKAGLPRTRAGPSASRWGKTRQRHFCFS